ncbi:hypothetical protein K439DRAFT_938510 [Ramaria rubella]|nr:hypothetical protein K439DRAFT_938510 [Ramaria rubella]
MLCARASALTSTLNLVIHLWFTMRTAFHNETPEIEKLRSLILLVSPYIMGLVPLAELSYRSASQYNLEFTIVGGFELAMVIASLIWDILLLFTFYTHRRIFRRVEMHRTMSLSLLIRISTFCFFRLVFTVVLLVDLGETTNGHSSASLVALGNISDVAESIYPLLGFCLLGTQRDILQVWFPRLIPPQEIIPLA